MGETDTLVQRDIMSAFLACYAAENRHDRSLLLSKWPAVEALLSDSGLCRKLTLCDVGSPASTKAKDPGNGEEVCRELLGKVTDTDGCFCAGGGNFSLHWAKASTRIWLFPSVEMVTAVWGQPWAESHFLVRENPPL